MRPEKKAILGEIKAEVEGHEYVLLADCRGLSVEQTNVLRLTVRDNGGCSVQVVKNRLMKIAAQDMGCEGLDDLLRGPTAMICGDDDVTVMAKALTAYAKEHKVFEIKGGLLGRRVLSGDDIGQLAQLPSREIMLGKFVGTVAAPLSQMVGVLNQKLCSLIYVLKAVEEKKAK